MTSPITPTIGRVVLYRETVESDCPALITRVWSDDCVNLQVLHDNAPVEAITSVGYDDSDAPPVRSWHWMPYQKAVAAGTVQPTQHEVK